MKGFELQLATQTSADWSPMPQPMQEHTPCIDMAPLHPQPDTSSGPGATRKPVDVGREQGPAAITDHTASHSLAAACRKTTMTSRQSQAFAPALASLRSARMPGVCADILQLPLLLQVLVPPAKPHFGLLCVQTPKGFGEQFPFILPAILVSLTRL
jgi:hypothetical protein